MLKVVRRHLEVLARPLVLLSLCDNHLRQDIKQAMEKQLLALNDGWTPGSMRLTRAVAPPDLIHRDGNLGKGWNQV